MLRRKTGWFWKSGFITINIMLVLSVLGYDDISRMETQTIKSEVHNSHQNGQGEGDKVIEICYDLYEKAEKENKLADLEIVHGIVNRLGKNGYSAIDSKNQIDMTEIEQVIRFCEAVDAKEEAKLIIIEVTYLGGFVEYDLQTKDGNVDVVRTYYEYKNRDLQKVAVGIYQTDYWHYTKDGYLMFSGVWFSEELYILTLSEIEEHTAFRVLPLDERCRELNRQYLLPIGYEGNNMFLVDWSEESFGELNFYDLYDIFYPIVNGQLGFYITDDDLDIGGVYRIAKDEFERVIMTYFSIDSETLQSKTIYYFEEEIYKYKPRGFDEVEYPEYPFPEVVNYMENSNGTIILTVNVVFPYSNISKVHAHEVVVRPLEDGRVQYVSNRIIPSKDNYEETWHTPRLTADKWEGM